MIIDLKVLQILQQLTIFIGTIDQAPYILQRTLNRYDEAQCELFDSYEKQLTLD